MKKIILLLSETWFLFKVLLFDHKLTPKFLYYINKINFIELLSCSLEKNIPLSNLKRLHIMLGNQCNYRCKMCGQKDFNQEMNPIIYKKRLVSCYPYLKEIILQGGEPTVVPKTKEFIEFLLKKNPKIKFGIMTNGYMFDNFWIQKFIKHGSFVNFSLNILRCPIYQTLEEPANITWFAVECENFESIHNHNAYAYIERDKVIGIVNFMCDTGHQHPQRGQFFTLNELSLK